MPIHFYSFLFILAQALAREQQAAERDKKLDLSQEQQEQFKLIREKEAMEVSTHLHHLLQ